MWVRTVGAAALLVVLAGCSGDAAAPASSATGGTPSPTLSAPVATGGVGGVGGVEVARTLATGLRVPWGVGFLPDGSALVAQRPTGQVVRIGVDGGTAPAGTVPGVADRGEGGLLGLAVLPPGTGGAPAPAPTSRPPTATGSLTEPVTVFAYLTTASDNRVVRMTYGGATLGRPTPILTGIPSASFHNGGLVTIGPDGKLWIGTGEGGVPSRAQDRNSLGGKILRINLDGSIPSDNPFPGSPVYSLGHRNVQGLAFDSVKQPWATEFGQDTWDELNRIVPGGNYGWPIVEGQSDRKGFISPLVQWPTDDASPSGLAIVRDVAYIGALRGERLWQVALEGTRTGEPKDYLNGEYGRIRTVAATPGGALWITTSNRDGRGSPRPGDDRVLLVELTS
jgi:aldose sugar dehydrogenase